VFLNLILNARDAMEAGGQLAVRTSASDGLVRVTVAIRARASLPKIWRAFSIRSSPPKARAQGTGLVFR